MPKLTEPLCAMRAPIKKYCNTGIAAAFKQMAPASLKNKVNPREPSAKAGRVCQPELASLLQCLKSHEFNESLCAKEVRSFNQCYDSHKGKKDLKETMAQRGIIGLSTKAMSGKQCNKLLRANPQPKKLDMS